MASEHRLTLKLPANTAGRGEFYFDISPPLTDVVSVDFIGYKLRASTVPQEIKITLDAQVGDTVDGFYSEGANMELPAGTIPTPPNNNGILLTPLALAVGLTDQTDDGLYSNSPQRVLVRARGAMTRVRLGVSDFSGQSTLCQWDGHLYLHFCVTRLPPGSTIYDGDLPKRRKGWQEDLRDQYIGDGHAPRTHRR